MKVRIEELTMKYTCPYAYKYNPHTLDTCPVCSRATDWYSIPCFGVKCDELEICDNCIFYLKCDEVKYKRWFE